MSAVRDRAWVKVSVGESSVLDIARVAPDGCVSTDSTGIVMTVNGDLVPPFTAIAVLRAQPPGFRGLRAVPTPLGASA